MELHFHGYEIRLLPLRRADSQDTAILNVKDIDAWWVEVPDLPGCVSHGKTPVLAMQSAQMAIEEWLETARELKRDIPSPLYFTGSECETPVRYRAFVQK